MLSYALSGHCRKDILNGDVVPMSDELKEGFGFSICHCKEVGIILCFPPFLCHKDFSSCLWRWYAQSRCCFSGCFTQAEFSREPLFSFLVALFFLDRGKHEFQLEEWDYSAHLFAFSFLNNKGVITVSLCLHYPMNLILKYFVLASHSKIHSLLKISFSRLQCYLGQSKCQLPAFKSFDSDLFIWVFGLVSTYGTVLIVKETCSSSEARRLGKEQQW